MVVILALAQVGCGAHIWTHDGKALDRCIVGQNNKWLYVSRCDGYGGVARLEKSTIWKLRHPGGDTIHAGIVMLMAGLVAVGVGGALTIEDDDFAPHDDLSDQLLRTWASWTLLVSGAALLTSGALATTGGVITRHNSKNASWVHDEKAFFENRKVSNDADAPAVTNIEF